MSRQGDRSKKQGDSIRNKRSGLNPMSDPAVEYSIPIPDIEHLVTEDDTPLDNFQSEKQQRLLVESLYSSTVISVPFVAAANVGLFYGVRQDPIVPDVLLSLNVEMPTDWSQKKNRSYFVWEFGKVPEICLEIVSNREGNELGTSRRRESKKDLYARIGVSYYAVFDPLRQLQEPDQMDGELLRVWALTVGRYGSLEAPFWLESVGLGLTVWEGEFEGVSGPWVRWCDRQGQVIPTGKERADQAQLRADRLAERLRAMGIDPDLEE